MTAPFAVQIVRPWWRTALTAATLCVVLGLAPASAAADPAAPPGLAHWAWPTASHHVSNPYAEPAGPYGPGHRGIDIDTEPGSPVFAPAAGSIAFVGSVGGRPLITIDEGDGLIATLEPVASDARAGDVVGAGDEVGTVAAGGHAAPGTMHLGVRRDGVYINPLLLLGGIPRAVLLPCCS